jgi:hypothetical protein
MKKYQRFITSLRASSDGSSFDERSALTKHIFDRLKLPLYYLLKDIKDTFKPYKTGEQVARDLIKQPFYGIGNIFRGVAVIFAAASNVLAGVLMLFSKNVQGELAKKYGYKNSRLVGKAPLFANALKRGGIDLVSSLLYLVRGITQVAAWPLTILRAPLRGLISVFVSNLIEDSQGLKELVNEFNQKIEGSGTQARIYKMIDQKFTKALAAKQKTELSFISVKVEGKDKKQDLLVDRVGHVLHDGTVELHCFTSNPLPAYPDASQAAAVGIFRKRIEAQYAERGYSNPFPQLTR